MLTSCEPPSRSASRAANSSALPVCDAHSTSGPSVAGGVGVVGGSASTAPASMPSIHSRTSALTGAGAGSTGTSASAFG